MSRFNLSAFPGHWVICDCCNGDGHHAQHLGAFTSSEWAEQDDDFKEDYLAGAFDRVCPECEGTGKVKEVSVSRCTFAQKRVLVAMRIEAEWKAEADRDYRAEQRHCGYEV